MGALDVGSAIGRPLFPPAAVEGRGNDDDEKDARRLLHDRRNRSIFGIASWKRLAAVLLFSAGGALLAAEPPVLRIPGLAGRPISPASLLGAGSMNVGLELSEGDSIVYHGRPLLDVVEKAGVDTRSMAGQRKTAPAVVVVRARDGYTVVFSMGELLMHRADPRVFLVSETAAGPLPENEGPVRLIVHGDRVRSPYALRDVELRYIGQNPGPEPAKPKK
jgi:hypothetical protein